MAHPRRITLALDWDLIPTTGWGVHGIQIALHLARHPRYRPMLLRAPRSECFHDPLTAARLRPLAMDFEDFHRRVPSNATSVVLELPVLYALGNQLRDPPTRHAGRPSLGIIAMEDAVLSPEAIQRARRYRFLVATSRWVERVLKASGIENVSTAHLGVDASIFHPAPNRGLFRDRFVIYSGGQLCWRKGQDLVLEAFRRFRVRHPEALLLLAWQTLWPSIVEDLVHSPYLRGVPKVTSTGRLDLVPWLLQNGLESDSFIDLGVPLNDQVGRILAESDVAVFTSRCEGGTNLMAKEALACGVPTILSANSGHMDLIDEGLGIPLKRQGRRMPGGTALQPPEFGESDPDEIVEALERVHADRAAARAQGREHARIMENWAWPLQVERMLAALEEPLDEWARTQP